MSDIFQLIFNENINRYLQDNGNSFIDFIFLNITHITDHSVYFLLASLIYWCYSKKMGIRVMYVILLSAYVAILAKNLFGLPRPSQVFHKIPENGFGFPSGHAMVSSGLWGYLSYTIRKQGVVLIGIFTIILVSVSRIYLGVHYVGDILGGILFGLFVAWLYIKYDPIISEIFHRLKRKSKYVVVLMFPIVLFSVSSIFTGFLKDSLELLLIMTTIGIGYLLEEGNIRFEDAKNNLQRFKRAVLGISVIGGIYLISLLLSMSNPDLVYFKYIAMGFASTYIIPWIFYKLECFS